jgi:hypothetical protein
MEIRWHEFWSKRLVLVLEPGRLLEASVRTSVVGSEVPMKLEQWHQSKEMMDSSNQSLQDRGYVFYDWYGVHFLKHSSWKQRHWDIGRRGFWIKYLEASARIEGMPRRIRSSEGWEIQGDAELHESMVDSWDRLHRFEIGEWKGSGTIWK